MYSSFIDLSTKCLLRQTFLQDKIFENSWKGGESFTHCETNNNMNNINNQYNHHKDENNQKDIKIRKNDCLEQEIRIINDNE